MKISLTAGTLESYISYLDPLVDEAKITLDDEGITTRAVDPANVGMVDNSLSADACKDYEVDSETVLGVNLARLSQLISMADTGELVTLELDPETRKLHIKYGGFSGTIALIDPDSIRAEPDIPELDLPAEVVLEGSDLDRAVDAADMVSDHVTLSVDEEAREFHVEAEGDRDDITLTLDEEDLINLDAGEAESIFSLDYLGENAKPIDSDAEVTMELGEDFPVKLHLEYASGQGAVTYMTAPRITN